MFFIINRIDKQLPLWLGMGKIITMEQAVLCGELLSVWKVHVCHCQYIVGGRQLVKPSKFLMISIRIFILHFYVKTDCKCSLAFHLEAILRQGCGGNV